jgi:hypothetical protein
MKVPVEPGLWIRIRIGYGFKDFVDPDLDPHWESGSRIKKMKKIRTFFVIYFRVVDPD